MAKLFWTLLNVYSKNESFVAEGDKFNLQIKKVKRHYVCMAHSKDPNMAPFELCRHKEYMQCIEMAEMEIIKFHACPP